MSRQAPKDRDELERSDESTAPITLCIGAGQGIATIIERK
jgi:acetyl-CoA C-acetyltransferase